MIDTIRFAIPLLENQLNELSRQLRSYLLVDLPTNQVEFQRWSKSIEAGSYSNRINIFVPDKDAKIVIIELSVPKIFHGDNIRLLRPPTLHNKLSLLQLYIKEAFNINLPNIELWKLQRIDLCYCWKFENDNKAQEILDIIKNMKVKRRKPNIYKESVSWVTKNSCYKFYLKYPEFMKHDMQRIFKTDPDRAYDLAKEAEGVLRFEITIRRRELERLRMVRVEKFYNLEEVEKILIKKLEQIIPLSNLHYMDDNKAYDKLILEYGKRKANSLFTFYKNWFSTDETLKNIAFKLNRTTIWRKWKDLEKTGLSIPINTKIILKINKNSEMLFPPEAETFSRGDSNTPRTLQDATK